MKKKIFAFIFAAAASFLIFAGFSACKKDDSETNGIIFNTLIINDASANLSVRKRDYGFGQGEVYCSA